MGGAAACAPVAEKLPQGGGSSALVSLDRPCADGHALIDLTPEQRWQVAVTMPSPVWLRELTSGSPPDGGPQLGDVAEWIAPEWFWNYPGWGTTTRQGAMGAGELLSDRAADIYIGEENGARLTPKYVHLDAKDFLVQIIPGYLTRVMGYGALLEGQMPGDTAVPSTPGPLFQVRAGLPVVVRFQNAVNHALELEVSLHLHGGHTPAHSDGHANFMIHPDEARDYYYPNAIPMKTEYVNGAWHPKRTGGPGGGPDWDYTEVQGTCWYHDHAEDITAHNALMGMAGFYIVRDAEEDRWVAEGILPPPTRDLPLGIRDVCLSPVEDPAFMDAEIRDRVAADPAVRGEARIHFDPFDHDGSLGNVRLVNGVANPVFRVQRGKYRLRPLNASLARFYNLVFVAVRRGEPGRAVPEGLSAADVSSALPFLRIGKDAWVLPSPVPVSSAVLGMAARADMVFDFKQPVTLGGEAVAPEDYDIYLVSTLVQQDGRGPGSGDNLNDGAANARGTIQEMPTTDDLHGWIWLAKFEFERDAEGRVVSVPDDQDCPNLSTTSALRAHAVTIEELVEAGIDPLDTAAVPVREFNFERGKGAWQINKLFYDPAVQNNAPKLWGVERWILRNKSGGWWHPIHIHLESHQQIYAESRDINHNKIAIKHPLYQAPGLEATQDEIVSSGDPLVWNLHCKHDTTVLGPNSEVHILMRFRTFQGPFVFHCHNLNHEDMRMMFQFDPRIEGGGTTDQPTRPDYWFFTEEIP
jgi:FtsP/CotA-like multicopper oxidase with cupredoxin domain